VKGVPKPKLSECVFALLLCLGVSGCAAHARPTVPDQFVTLNSHSLRLHFDNHDAPAGRPLIVYATGDGGMHRKDLDTYRHLAALGDPIVGFDARDYVKHLGRGSPTTTPERLAEDYRTIIARARGALGLSDHRPVVLVGVSRGAGLAVVAAARLRDVISGVVAVALTQEEEYVRWYRHLPLPHEARRAVMVDVYEYLADLGDVPIAVVQSTHDRYLPAVEARAQFGPDTPSRWFQSIEAANHNFGGARSRMYEAIRNAVTWITPRSKELHHRELTGRSTPRGAQKTRIDDTSSFQSPRRFGVSLRSSRERPLKSRS
jgi:pimeloyl-ACP methyl ester carboxylesterase